MSSLPLMREVVAPNPSPMTLDGTRTFIIGEAKPVVIAPGPADTDHLETLLAALGGVPPIAILLTHLHPDHAAGAPALATATGAPILVGAGAMDTNLLSNVRAEVLSRPLSLPTDIGVLQSVASPGHVPEHLCFHWTGSGLPAGGVVFVGDLLMGVGDTTLVSPPEGDLREYLRSLERVRALGAATLHPAHGPAIHDPAVAIDRYRAHRLARIQQVERALRGRSRLAPGQLVDEVYGAGLEPGLRAAAAGSIAAVIDFLEREGRL
jgi:glyoxylase-like metal-dependent hydrolase (beta-lactamase superfamily II)